MDFNIIEKFDNHNCGIDFNVGNITTKECKYYTDESYQKLRNDYLQSIITKFLDSDLSNKECIMNLLTKNIQASSNELYTMNYESNNYEDNINKKSLELLSSSIDLDELENNVLLGEQRIKETDELLYINNIKYYAIIVSLIVILIIELILIKL
jgi:hypothetical protein